MGARVKVDYTQYTIIDLYLKIARILKSDARQVVFQECT